MDQLIAVAVFGALVAVLAVGGIRLGMLLAPHIDRPSEPNDEADRADDD